MNRVEFMETLSRLLQDIPEEDRIDALKYYNDYFDDAGSENEQNVIERTGKSPEKSSDERSKRTGKTQYQYYQEDTYGEEKDNKIYQDNGTYDYESQEKKPWTNKWLKLAMIIAIVVIGFPIVIPLGAGILALIAGIVIAVFCLFAAIVIGFAAVVMVGVVLFCCRNRKPVRQSGCGTCGSWSRTDGDRDRCNRYRSWSKTLYYRISGNRQRNCIYFKKTISQKGGGIRDEETLENILDSCVVLCF